MVGRSTGCGHGSRTATSGDLRLHHSQNVQPLFRGKQGVAIGFLIGEGGASPQPHARLLPLGGLPSSSIDA